MATWFGKAQGWLPRDLGRLIEDSVAFLRCLLTTDPVELGLGQLSAASRVAVRGRSNRYVVTIASTRSEPVNVTLVIDIGAVDATPRFDGQYAHFSKHLKALPGVSTRVEIEYDWNARVAFLVDDTLFPPDEIGGATRDGSARYSVSATLLDARGNRLDLLTVYQELAP